MSYITVCKKGVEEKITFEAKNMPAPETSVGKYFDFKIGLGSLINFIFLVAFAYSQFVVYGKKVDDLASKLDEIQRSQAITAIAIPLASAHLEETNKTVAQVQQTALDLARRVGTLETATGIISSDMNNLRNMVSGLSTQKDAPLRYPRN